MRYSTEPKDLDCVMELEKFLVDNHDLPPEGCFILKRLTEFKTSELYDFVRQRWDISDVIYRVEKKGDNYKLISVRSSDTKTDEARGLAPQTRNSVATRKKRSRRRPNMRGVKK